MSDDVPFTPRLGRPRDLGRAGGKRFSAQLKKAAARLSKSGGRSRFSGAQIGRGSAAGRAASFRRHPFAKFRMRRVIVKTHIARAGKGIGKAAFKAHLKYIQRDGVDRDGHGGDLYGAEKDRLSDRGFIERSEDDRHQFRVIVSPEDADQLGDLKENTRTLMTRMEKDLGTKLDWVAVDHYNTGHPHTHIVIRGKDARGRDLVIAGEYLTQGLRRQASDLVTERLGPRRDLEIARSQVREVTADRLTGLDRKLAHQMHGPLLNLAATQTSFDRYERTLALRRLAHLQSLGLARRSADGPWALSDGWQDTLKVMGRRGDKIRELAAASRDQPSVPGRIYDPTATPTLAVAGRVIADGPADELRDTRFLIVDGLDGNRWHIATGERLPGTLPPPGAVIEVAPSSAAPRASDRTIARIAAQTSGRYSTHLHQEIDPAARPAYIQSHVRRLEALRRAGLVDRAAGGVFEVPKDHLQRAAAYEAARTGGIRLTVKSWVSIEAQIEHEGVTWLDDLGADKITERGFGSEAAKAKQARQVFLRQRGWLDASGQLDASKRPQLAARELHEVARAQTHSGAYVPAAEGSSFSGVYERPIDLAQGRFALIAKSKEFTLVPWRPELERHRGAMIDVRARAGGVDWTVGTARGIGR